MELSPSPLTKVQAQLNHLSLLIEDQKFTAAQTLLPSIQSQLAQLSPSRAAIYAQINFAQSLNKLLSAELRVPNTNPHSSLSPQNPTLTSQNSKLSTQSSALLLAKAIEQSRSLGDQQTEAYALLSLGNLYEENQQLSEAQKLTKQALVLAQTSGAKAHQTSVSLSANQQCARNSLSRRLAIREITLGTKRYSRSDRCL